MASEDEVSKSQKDSRSRSMTYEYSAVLSNTPVGLTYTKYKNKIKDPLRFEHPGSAPDTVLIWLYPDKHGNFRRLLGRRTAGAENSIL
jgi:hypothetical protein